LKNYVKRYSDKRRKFSLMLSRFVKLFYPDICVMCGEIGSGAFCEKCRVYFDEAINCRCEICGNIQSKCLCDDHIGKNISLIHMALYHPRARGTAISSLVLEMKHGTSGVISEAARAMACRLREIPNISRYSVTWVPRRKSGIKREGCDQSKRLAIELASELKLDAIELLCNTGRDEQKHMSRTQRDENVKRSYYATDISPEYVILVDDITTTSATLGHCAKIIRANGAKFVICIAMAKTEQGTATSYEKISPIF
jgi:predicted amidophosphoribosyltransferase